MAGAPSQGPFEWAPERVIEEQIPLQNTSWEKEFGELISKAFSLEEMGGPIRRVAPSFLRSATNALSLPMSILWGLQQLSPEGEWRTKEELTIHVSFLVVAILLCQPADIFFSRFSVQLRLKWNMAGYSKRFYTDFLD